MSTDTSIPGNLAQGYADWFQAITGFAPHGWQQALGADPRCANRLIRVPTGFGKTAGTALAWLYHRVASGAARKNHSIPGDEPRHDNEAWPRRLVFVLPMRVLVEQTERALRGWLARANLAGSVDLHVLMGGVRAEPWVLTPETPAILLGTQDMILSRALNRGYGAARGRWPMDFALLHHDALWILDEIQLMDVGLMTSVQLAAFRHQSARGAHGPALRPAYCWWMSATLQPDWLRSTDADALVAPLADAITEIPRDQRHDGLWAIRKPAERRADVSEPAAIAELVRARHRPGTLSLIMVNRVDRAAQVTAAVRQIFAGDTGKRRGQGKDHNEATPRHRSTEAPAIHMVHSRFRGAERRAWSNDFLHRDASMPAAGRILIATQVIEAGVDVSASLLITELAPWSSLVQRCGRAARYPGEQAGIVVVGPVPARDRDAVPYAAAVLEAADQAWAQLIATGGDASLHGLTELEDTLRRDHADLLAGLHPYAPAHVLTRADLDSLFDTTADLTGADIDVSCFVRAGQERDLSVAWRPIAPRRPKTMSRDQVGPVHRDELCPVPVHEARDWLKQNNRVAYVFDYLDGAWVHADPRRLAPGMLLLVPADQGGYAPDSGWDPKSKQPVVPVAALPAGDAEGAANGSAAAVTTTAAAAAAAIDTTATGFLDAAAAEDDDSASVSGWKTIATHGAETAAEVQRMCEQLDLPAPWRAALMLAARWHDAGKAHPVFRDAIRTQDRDQDRDRIRDLAKAPAHAWRWPPYPERPGFRHELASTLALFELLRRTCPAHPALLGPEHGPHRMLLEAAGMAPAPLADDERIAPDHPLAAELAALDAHDFDLVAYLVCSHHGKVRCTWTGTPRDQDRHTSASHAQGGTIHGVAGGDRIDALRLSDAAHATHALPSLTLHLDAAGIGLNGRYGASWSERVSGLVHRLGPFALAYLECLLRAADWRASQLTTEDPLV